MYAVLHGKHLAFFKDQKHKEEKALYHGEEPLNLEGCSVNIAAEYTKKKNVLALRLPSGAEYLLQTANEVSFGYICKKFQLCDVRRCLSVPLVEF